MRIIIAGIHHYDPYCPKKVIYLLESLRSLSFIPDCIAAEWDREVAEKVIAQRPHFVSLATSGGLFNHDEAVALTKTIAYEADVHKSIYPDMPIIWLDELSNEERLNKEEEINSYARDRYIIFKHRLARINKGDRKLAQLSTIFWNEGWSNRYDARDEKFFNKICEAEKASYSNVFVLVGAKHADPEIEDNLYNKLIDAGYNVQVFMLDPAFTENTPIELGL